MPDTFTCRLLVIRTENGKLKLRYGYLGQKCERILVIHGPAMLIPPDNEMTDEEFGQWEFQKVTGTGFSYSYGDLSFDSALVEVKRTFEDQIPPGSVTAQLFWAENQQGDRTLGVQSSERMESASTEILVVNRLHLRCTSTAADWGY